MKMMAVGLFRGSEAEAGPGTCSLTWSLAYFLLSSLARQVAASTALMAAARRPPFSRA